MRDEVRMAFALPARPEALRFVRAVVGGFARLLGADPETVRDVQLAVHEAAANVVEHAYEGQEGILELEVRPEPESLVVVITDTTTTSVEATPAHGAFDAETEDGRGVPIMAAVSDELELRHRAGTQTELRFALAPQAPRATQADGKR